MCRSMIAASLAVAALGLVAPISRGADASPAYMIAFTSFAPLDNDVFIAQGDGSAARPLLSGRWHDYNAALSADGAWVTFTSERTGSADIYRVHPDGSSLQPLVTGPAFDDQGALSPDGATLAFVSDRTGQADIWLLTLATGALTNLTHHPAGDFRPAWSPDGQWLAFSSDRESPRRKMTFSTLHSTAIYIMRRDGSQVRRVGDAGAFAGSPSWSADGRSIVYYECTLADVGDVVSPRRKGGTTQIASIDIQTGEHRVLSAGPGEKWSPHWLPGARLGYVSGGATPGLEFLSGEPGARGEIRSPSWSADGRTMVFHRDTAGRWPPHQHWHSLDPAFALLRTGVFPSYLPDGSKIVLNDRTAGILHNNIIRIDATGAAPTMLFHDTTRSALAPVVSPSGRQIAFGLGGFFQVIQGKASADIAVIDSDGANLRILTDGTGNFGLPSWSPDGRQLVYRAAGGARDGLYILDVASGRTRHLPGTGTHDNFPAWSPLGDRISFTSNRDDDYEIYTIHPDGTGLTRLTHRPGNDAHNSWSPDGKWLAFTSEAGGFHDEAVLHPYNPQPYGDLHVMRADGSDVRRLTDNQFEEGTPSWAPVASLPPPAGPTRPVARAGFHAVSNLGTGARRAINPSQPRRRPAR